MVGTCAEEGWCIYSTKDVEDGLWRFTDGVKVDLERRIFGKG